MWIITTIVLIIVAMVILVAIVFSSKSGVTFLSNDPTRSIDYSYDIVGELSYQGNLEKIAGSKQIESKHVVTNAKVTSEPTNKYDKNAIKVEINGLMVGYIPKGEAVRLAGKKINKTVPCLINGGWLDDTSEGNFGVKLAINSIHDLI